MIVTVTLNVAVDKSYVIDTPLHVGEVMRVKTCSNTAGGKGLNVSKVIQLCGEDVLATGFCGGFNGAYVEKMLEEKGVRSRFVHVEGETRSCINVLASDGTSTEFLEPGAAVSEQEVELFSEQFGKLLPKCQVVTMSGSAPGGVSNDIYARMIRMGREAGVKMILDTSKDYLKEGCKALPYLIKPNQDEIAQLLGKEVGSENEMIEGARQLCAQGISHVVLSLGAKGALDVSRQGVCRAVPPKIDAVNTVGCGDSMVGAMAVALERGWSMQERMRYACAVSAANAMNLETGYFRKEDMEAIYEKVAVEWEPF